MDNLDLLKEQEEVIYNINLETSFDQSVKEELLSLFSVPVFYDEKDEENYTKKVIKLIRSSYEYSLWRNYINETFDLKRCVFTGEDKAKIELHHYPLSLRDYTIIALDTLLQTYDRKDINTFIVAKEVLKMHFDLHVGIVPLIETLHDKYHKENFLIPKEWIFGEWKYYISQECKYYVREEFIEKIKKAENYNIDSFVEYAKKVWWVD